MKAAFVVVVAAAIGALVATALQHARARAATSRAERAEAAIDSLAAEAAAARAELSGWKVKFAEASDLAKLLETRDSQLAVLARDLRASRAKVRSLTRIVAEAAGSASVVAEAATPDSATGIISDGTLSAKWTFYYATPGLSLRYSCLVPVEAVAFETGDGRLLVTARSSSPNVSLQIAEALVNLPEPTVERRGVSWLWIPAAFLGGLAIGGGLP